MKLTAKDLREKTPEELQEELNNLYVEQFNLLMHKGTGQLSKPNQMKDARKNIARIKTIQNETMSTQS